MKKTRREFSLLSGLGIGGLAARASALSTGNANEPQTLCLHDEPGFSCFEVSLARGRGSELLATFGRAPGSAETGDILLKRSYDGGATWQASDVLFSNSSPGHQLAGLTRVSDGTLIASTTRLRFLFGGQLRWRRGSETDGVFVRTSVDGGRTWGEERKVDTSPYQVAWTRGAIVEMPDGSLLLPLAGQVGKSYRAVREPMASFVLRSVDRGQHWRYHSTIAQDSAGARDYDEPAMVSLDGGRLLCMLRSHVSPRRDPAGGYLFMTLSDDGGAIWGNPKKTSLWGHPAHLLRLRDGRVLATFGYRMHPDPGVRACISRDGAEWKPRDIFTVHAQPDLDSQNLQIGCPSSVELDDGSILTAYQVWSGDRLRLEGRLHRV
jgi:hypothetical protein